MKRWMGTVMPEFKKAAQWQPLHTEEIISELSLSDYLNDTR